MMTSKAFFADYWREMLIIIVYFILEFLYIYIYIYIYIGFKKDF